MRSSQSWIRRTKSASSARSSGVSLALRSSPSSFGRVAASHSRCYCGRMVSVPISSIPFCRIPCASTALLRRCAASERTWRFARAGARSEDFLIRFRAFVPLWKPAGLVSADLNFFRCSPFPTVLLLAQPSSAKFQPRRFHRS
jgi:hypothetical protein